MTFTYDVPAHAGVSPRSSSAGGSAIRRPRARGGEPSPASLSDLKWATSPRTRG